MAAANRHHSGKIVAQVATEVLQSPSAVMPEAIAGPYPDSSNYWCCLECRRWFCPDCGSYHCNWFDERCPVTGRRDAGTMTRRRTEEDE